MPCVRVCCPRKNILINGKCNDGFKEKISLSVLNLTLNDTLDVYPTVEELRMAPQPNLSEVLVLREQFQSCDQVVSLREDEYRILKDGSIFVYKNVQILGKEEYCLYPQFNSEFPQSIWVVHHICNKVLLPATIESN
ncbi:probable G-protein coupled receptor Mth-like 12 [Drosophila takahashii]|uniref:probable G-protein coupled receptor Mth-like 12 n=1 Tax=Drosophila takahashii TaxID=29030 RepID=UPI0038994275